MRIKQLEEVMGTQELVAVAHYIPKEGVPSAKPATVQAIRQPRKVYSGARWDFTGHTAHDGVTVEFADGSRETVGQQKVVAKWLDHQKDAEAAKAKTKSEADKIADQKDACEKAVARLGLGSVVAKHPYGRNEWKVIGYEVKLSAAEASMLADRL